MVIMVWLISGAVGADIEIARNGTAIATIVSLSASSFKSTASNY